MKSLDARIRKYIQKVAEKEKEVEQLEMKLAKSIKTATIEEMDMEFAALTKGIDALQAELDKLEEQDASTAVSSTKRPIRMHSINKNVITAGWPERIAAAQTEIR